jgi:hypothetical protein
MDFRFEHRDVHERAQGFAEQTVEYELGTRDLYEGVVDEARVAKEDCDGSENVLPGREMVDGLEGMRVYDIGVLHVRVGRRREQIFHRSNNGSGLLFPPFDGLLCGSHGLVEH